MRFYTHQHPFYCGIDLHARSMDVCRVNRAGEILLHRTRKAAPAPFLQAIAPYREALARQASPDATAKNDTIDAHKIAVLLRGGLRPQAAVSPAPMRATRALRRRRMPLRRKRAALLAHGQNTNSQYNLPAIGKKIAYQANRDGVAERFADPAVQKNIEVDLAPITYYDALLRGVERPIVKTARHHDANTLYLLHTVPGIGKILRLVLRYAIHEINRFPQVQDFVSYCRLVKCAKAAGGKRLGTAGATSGKTHLKWAFSEAAVVFLRDHPTAQKYLARLEKKHDKGKAVAILAQKLARAVYHMRKRNSAFNRETFFQA
jgi:transposase